MFLKVKKTSSLRFYRYFGMGSFDKEISLPNSISETIEKELKKERDKLVKELIKL